MGELLREKPFLRAVLVCVLVPLLFRASNDAAVKVSVAPANVGHNPTPTKLETTQQERPIHVLAPLKAWLKNPTGERPLKHWKEVRIKSHVLWGGYEPCCGGSFNVTIDNYAKTISLRNLPVPTWQAFQKLSTFERQVQGVTASLAAERIRVRYNSANSPAIAPVGSEYGEQIRQNNVDGANLQTRIEKFDSLKSPHEDAKNAAAEFSCVLAMFTGLNNGGDNGGEEIWDCGR